MAINREDSAAVYLFSTLNYWKKGSHIDNCSLLSIIELCDLEVNGIHYFGGLIQELTK